MKWIDTTLAMELPISRGAILRCNGEYPYESKVDLMIAEMPDDCKVIGLYVVSGYKSGICLGCIPQEFKDTQSNSITVENLIHFVQERLISISTKNSLLCFKGRPKPR
jgi:hypothetical protein